MIGGEPYTLGLFDTAGELWFLLGGLAVWSSLDWFILLGFYLATSFHRPRRLRSAETSFVSPDGRVSRLLFCGIASVVWEREGKGEQPFFECTFLQAAQYLCWIVASVALALGPGVGGWKEFFSSESDIPFSWAWQITVDTSRPCFSFFFYYWYPFLTPFYSSVSGPSQDNVGVVFV